MYLLRIQLTEGRRYYAGYDGMKPSLRTKGAGARMDAKLCATVLRQLKHLGFDGFEPVDEVDTDTVVKLS